MAGREGPRLGREIEKRAREYLPDAESKFDQAIRIAEAHDEMIDLCASAFQPNGAGSRKTGFVFITSEPLVELDVKNFDLLIYDPASQTAVFIECKTSISSTGSVIKDSVEAAHHVRERLAYLESTLGLGIRHTEFVVCCPAEHVVDLVRDLERREKRDKPTRETSLKIWSMNHLFDTTIVIDPRVGTLPRLHASKPLNEFLKKARVGKDLVAFRGHPSSHPAKLALECLAEVLRRNIRHSRHLKTVTESDVIAIFANREHVPHYAMDEFGKKMSSRIWKLLQEADVIALGDDGWRIKAAGTYPDTIIDTARAKIRMSEVRRMARWNAESEVVSSYLDKQQRLPGH